MKMSSTISSGTCVIARSDVGTMGGDEGASMDSVGVCSETNVLRVWKPGGG
jgi:hypothetical protein